MMSSKRTTRLIVHGGAWDIPDALVDDHISGVRSAIEQVAPQLEAGMNAIDAVEAAVNVLEAHPVFDAGRGSFLNADGEIELDAMIMNGRDLNFGAVAALQNILHPISVAKAVYTHPDHCFFVGRGAQRFAADHGFPELKPEELLTDRELEYFHQIKSDPDFKPHHPFEETPKGTVGAVAMDANGNIAAATSTGGTPRKMPGRVGDTPLIGSGTYADNSSGGVSVTGWGEAIMKVLLAKTICDSLTSKTADAAIQNALNILRTRVSGLAGAIAVSRTGEYGLAHNTPRMAFAYQQTDGDIKAGIRLT
ncbi:MAG: isoaspartyl peptidase/L-asparaginase [Calditrichia bacterium]